MRLDTPLTTDLGLGVQRRIIDPGDSIVDVPSTIGPVVESIAPTQLGGFLTTTVNSQSFIVNDLRSLNNQAAVVANVVATLGPGIWRIQPFVSMYNKVTTAISINQFWRYGLSNGVFQTNILTHGLLDGGAINLYEITPPPFRVLLRDQCTLTFDCPATGLNDFIFIWATFDCMKEI